MDRAPGSWTQYSNLRFCCVISGSKEGKSPKKFPVGEHRRRRLGGLRRGAHERGRRLAWSCVWRSLHPVVAVARLLLHLRRVVVPILGFFFHLLLLWKDRSFHQWRKLVVMDAKVCALTNNDDGWRDKRSLRLCFNIQWSPPGFKDKRTIKQSKSLKKTKITNNNNSNNS